MDAEFIEFEEELTDSPFKQSNMRSGEPLNNAGISQELWQSNIDLAIKSLHHPFVLALAQGTLPKQYFQSYVAEDSFFLRSFARGYQVAAARVNRSGIPHAKAAAAAAQLDGLHDGIVAELEMHESYAAKWGVDLAARHTSPAPATAKYVNFLSEILNDDDGGGEESVGGILAAMVPCLRLYAFLGCTLSKAFPEARHAYVEWLQTYMSHAYVKMPAIAEMLLDELSVNDSKGEFSVCVAIWDGGKRQ